MRCQASSQLGSAKSESPPKMSHSRSTSIANRSNNNVNRELTSAQGNRTLPYPVLSLQLIREDGHEGTS